MENQIRVKSANKYIIDVNDDGDTIEFDVTDTDLASKVFKMADRIDELTKKAEAEAKAIEEREDKPIHEYRLSEDKTLSLTQNQKDSAALYASFYTEARGAVDIVFGAGACQKIFGGSNYENMFNDLFEQMQPHFKKMGINADKIKKSAAEKYAPSRATRRALR